MTAHHATHRVEWDPSCGDCLRLYGDPIQTDEEPWAVAGDDIEAHPHLRLLALVALIVAVALVFAARGAR